MSLCSIKPAHNLAIQWNHQSLPVLGREVGYGRSETPVLLSKKPTAIGSDFGTRIETGTRFCFSE
jgi:hypothetical protein